MICKCGGKSLVISTVKHEVSVFRQRKCTECGRKWLTEEKESNSLVGMLALSNRSRKDGKK